MINDDVVSKSISCSKETQCIKEDINERGDN